MFLLTIAASFMAPEPLARDSWFSPYLDIPRTGLQRDSWTRILIELTVTAQGTVAGCEARVVEGNPNMGPYTCKRMMSRARLRPARDATGNKMYGIYRTSVVWWIGPSEMPEPVPSGHYQGVIGSWPNGVEAPAFSSIQFVVDEVGRIGSCERFRNKAPNVEITEQVEREAALLAPIACALMTKKGSIAPAKTRGGEAVASIQTATVRLEPAKAP